MKKCIFLLLFTLGLAGIVCGMSVAEEDAVMKKQTKALKSRDYSAARDLTFRLIRSSQIEVNTASEYILLGLVDWCLRKDGEAKWAISSAIRLMKNGAKLGGGCEARAVILLQRLKRVPRQLSYREINDITVFIMEIPYAQWRGEMDRINARYGAAAKMSAPRKRKEDVQAAMAQLYAKQEFEKNTQDTFDPYVPPRIEEMREKWDACRRIHDIWGN